VGPRVGRTVDAIGGRDVLVVSNVVLAVGLAVLAFAHSQAMLWWGRSTKDLIDTLDGLHGRGVSVLPLNGQSFDLNSANGKLMRTLIAALAEFERDLIKERVKSGLARVKAIIDRDGEYTTKSGKVRKKLGRRAGYRPSDKHTKKVLELAKEGLSYRLIGRNLGLSKNTVMGIIKRRSIEAAA
jgi:putative DNA-invertase from lambdoid prophage Rac